MKKFLATAWIHPQCGGDDECFDLELEGPSMADAREYMVKWLKNHDSAVLDDYIIKEVKSFPRRK